MAIVVTHSKTLIAPDSGAEDKVYGSDYVDPASHTVALGADDNFVTDAQLVVIGNTSGTNTGDAASQPVDADLTAIAALTSAADKVPYSTGAQTWALASFTAAGRALVDDADAAAQRTTLGLGTIATQAASAVAITGGTAVLSELGIGAAAIYPLRVYSSPASGRLVDLTQGNSGAPNYIAFNNSATTLKALWGLSNNAEELITGSVAGDMNLRNQGGALLVSTDSGTTAGLVFKSNKLGVNTLTPDKVCEINLGTASAFRLTYNDANGSAATYMDTTLSSAGVTTFTGAGSAPTFNFAQAVTFAARADLKSYTVATLPAAGADGGIVYASDAAVAPCLAFSNGTVWKRCDNAATTVV